MKENKLKKIYGGLCLSSVFRSVWDSPLLRAYEAYCLCEDGKTFEKYKAYAAFVAEIYRQGGSLTELVKRLVFEDENVYIKGVANGKALPAALKDSAKSELRCFAAFGALTRADFAADMGTDEARAARPAAYFRKAASRRNRRYSQRNRRPPPLSLAERQIF